MMTNAESLAAAAKSRRPTYVEVDLKAIAANVKTFRALLPDTCRLLAVVKADAYGHGAVPVARKALEAGAEWLAVALPQEALELREAGILAPILVLGYTPKEDMADLAAAKVRPGIYTLEQARELSAAAEALGITAPYHLKIDSGMGASAFCRIPPLWRRSGKSSVCPISGRRAVLPILPGRMKRIRRPGTPSLQFLRLL